MPMELYSSEAFVLDVASRDVVRAHPIEELAMQDQRDTSLRWFALQVRATAERYLANLLVRKGYECFLPLNSQNDDSPLFPGYIFCRFEASRRLPILMTPGVMRVVGIGQIPAPLDETEIFSLQEAIRRRFLIKPWSSVPTGSAVKIVSGPMNGLTGRLHSVKNRQSVVITLTLLQRSVMAEVDDHSVLIG
jgi:transcriptional antiterminator RfaH